LPGASQSRQCFGDKAAIQASSEAPKQAPVCYTGELKKTNLKKRKRKGLYQIAAQESVSFDLPNKASQPAGTPAGTVRVSLFGDHISWFRCK